MPFADHALLQCLSIGTLTMHALMQAVMVGAQSALFWWKKKDKRSYELVRADI